MVSRRSFLQSSAAAISVFAASRVTKAGAENAPSVTDAATIKIGMVLSVTGSSASEGVYALTGAKIALDRVNKAGSTEPDKLRAAILATKGYKGAEGEYNFDEFGDGLHGYNIVRNERGVIVFEKHIEFTD